MLTITKTLLKEYGEKFQDNSITDAELETVMEQLRSSAGYYKADKPITDRNHSTQQAVRDFVGQIAPLIPAAHFHTLVERLILLEHEATKAGNTATVGAQAGKNLGLMRNASLAKSFYEYEMAHYPAEAMMRMEASPMDAIKPHWRILLPEGIRIFSGQEELKTQPATKEENLESGRLKTNIANIKHDIFLKAADYYNANKIDKSLYNEIRKLVNALTKIHEVTLFGAAPHEEGVDEATLRERFKTLITHIEEIEGREIDLLGRMREMLNLTSRGNATQKFSEALRALRDEVEKSDKLDEHAVVNRARGF